MTEHSLLNLLLLISDLIVIVLGIVIGYIAYQGYKRNDSRPMIFIGLGFVFTFGGPGLIFILLKIVPLPGPVAGVLTQVSEIIGMGLILYGFVVPARSTEIS